MGYDINRFRGPLSSVVLCTICQNVLDDPVQSYNCKHVYCRKCVQPLIVSDCGDVNGKNMLANCPKCKKTISPGDLQVPKNVNNFLQHLEIKCDYLANGCLTWIKLEDLPAHREQCLFNPENSVTCTRNCGAIMKRSELEKHCCLNYLQSIITERDACIDELMKESHELKTENHKYRTINVKLKEEIEKQKEEIRKLKLQLDSKKGISSMLKFDLLYSSSKAVSEEHRMYIKELRNKGLIISNHVFEAMILVDITNFTVKDSSTKKA